MQTYLNLALCLGLRTDVLLFELDIEFQLFGIAQVKAHHLIDQVKFLILLQEFLLDELKGNMDLVI